MSDEANDNFLAMSDEEFMAQDLDATSNEETVTVVDDDTEEVSEAEEVTESDSEVTEGEGAAEPEVSEEEAEGTDEAEEDSEGDSDKEEPAAEKTEAELHKEFYDQLMTPFKANGKDFHIENAADAIQLMQMGAGFNKKMAALKPNLKSLRLLEKHGLLSEEKLNFLIDIDKKDPKAIAKLLGDSNIDPMDIDVDTGKEYRAPDRRIDDGEMELNTILDDLQESPKYNQLLDVVSNKWDNNSRQLVAATPQLLNVIHDHMSSGIYDQISQTVERERTLGRLRGLTDLEAYRKVGDDLNERGVFNNMNTSAATQETGSLSESAKRREVNLNVTEKKDATLSNKRKAAGATKSKVNAGKSIDFNPLSMSDEEFMKQFNPDLM